MACWGLLGAGTRGTDHRGTEAQREEEEFRKKLLENLRLLFLFSSYLCASVPLWSVFLNPSKKIKPP
jgi:hypothetical protein